MSTTSSSNLSTAQLAPACVAAEPEFVDFCGLRTLFAIPRSTAYELIEAGEIRSVSLRRKGNIRGRRLIDCASVRAYLNRQAS